MDKTREEVVPKPNYKSFFSILWIVFCVVLIFLSLLRPSDGDLNQELASVVDQGIKEPIPSPVEDLSEKEEKNDSRDESDKISTGYMNTTSGVFVTSDRTKASKQEAGRTMERTDTHWGSDEDILRLREMFRDDERNPTKKKLKRPPIFLMPGLVSSQLVAWRRKSCKRDHTLLSDIETQDTVWINMKQVLQMSAFEYRCWLTCMTLGVNQTDTNCKLRPQEGLAGVATLSAGALGAQLLGGGNVLYDWTVRWLADHLGYDVTSVFGLPYDWRLSPDHLQNRDGFFTTTRRRIEMAVEDNGAPAILVIHSMGNVVFRYFLEWLRHEMRLKAYARYKQYDRAVLWELAEAEGDEMYQAWLDKHVWAYVGLSGPHLGVLRILRSVLSGDDMGLPITAEAARVAELSYGSTNTLNPISTAMAFCDQWNGTKEEIHANRGPSKYLMCLEDLAREIDVDGEKSGKDPWMAYPQLRSLLKDRIDWDTDFAHLSVIHERCSVSEADDQFMTTPVEKITPHDITTGDVYLKFNGIWKEKGTPLLIKRDQLVNNFWEQPFPNILGRTYERPPIKHVIMAYGADNDNEVGHVYEKQCKNPVPRSNPNSPHHTNKEDEEFDGIPYLKRKIWERANGEIYTESMETKKTSSFLKKQITYEYLRKGSLDHSGDGTVSYMSLIWVHTWLLHTIREKLAAGKTVPEGKRLLDSIKVSHRRWGEEEWRKGPLPSGRAKPSIEDVRKNSHRGDTGTRHTHGTMYKPEMTRYHSVGKSERTGQEYSTTVIEAYGVGHEETTRNYDLLSAVFRDIMRQYGKDFG